MSKNIKINLGKRQLSPEEIALVEQGLYSRKENTFGRPTIIQGKKYNSELRIVRTRYPTLGMPVPNEDLYIYNANGDFVRKIHNSKY